MPLAINTNINSIIAQTNLARSGARLNTSLERLSTGLKINRGADGAAALVISENQKAEINGLQVAIRNIDRAVSATNTADGGLNNINEILLKARSLAVDSSNAATNDQTALTANQTELTELLTTLNSISTNTKFGSKTLLDGSFTAQVFQIGFAQSETATFTIQNTNTTTLGISGINVSSQTGASAAIVAIDAAITSVTNVRGTLGAFTQNRLRAVQSNLTEEVNNLQNAESIVRDTDYQAEITRFTNEQIRNQTSNTVLGLANQQAQSILSLLQG